MSLVRALAGVIGRWLDGIERALVALAHDACPCGDHEGAGR